MTSFLQGKGFCIWGGIGHWMSEQAQKSCSSHSLRVPGSQSHTRRRGLHSHPAGPQWNIWQVLDQMMWRLRSSTSRAEMTEIGQDFHQSPGDLARKGTEPTGRVKFPHGSLELECPPKAHVLKTWSPTHGSVELLGGEAKGS
jgi:hypothetical protein